MVLCGGAYNLTCVRERSPAGTFTCTGPEPDFEVIFVFLAAGARSPTFAVTLRYRAASSLLKVCCADSSFALVSR
jgi:hypothetical protein